MASIEPIHPGEHLAEILDELSVTEYRLAKTIGTPPRRINEIVHGRRSIIGGHRATTRQGPWHDP